MPDYIQPFCADYKGIKANPPGLAPADAARIANVALTGALPNLVVPVVGEEIVGVQLAGDNGVVAWGDLASEVWYFADTGAAGAVEVSANAAPLVQYDDALQSAIVFITDATPLSVALAGAGVTATLQTKNPNRWLDQPGEASFSAFQENVASYDPDLTAQLVVLDRDLRARGSLAILPDGTVVKGCAATYIGPRGVTFVDITDVGGGPSQLPPAPENLTAQALNNHPSVFVRGTDSLRSVSALVSGREFANGPAIADGVALVVDEGGGDFTVNAQPFTIDTPPLFSEWVVVLDGVTYRGWFEVPGGNPSGFTRPRELYEAIFGDGFGRDGSSPVFVYTFDAAGTRFLARQVIRDWEHLVYARITGYATATTLIQPQPVYEFQQPDA